MIIHREYPKLTAEDIAVPLDTLRPLYLQPLTNAGINRGSSSDGPLGRLHALVTGGAGFVGSHLTDRLMLLGATVTVIDDLSTGSIDNISHWLRNRKLIFIQQDIRTAQLNGDYDVIFHLASPASPPHYQHEPVRTLMTNVQGTLNVLGHAVRCSALPLFLLASTSEVYGDPQVHPQPESYCGCVNQLGPRACYDEGKRCAETLVSIFHSQHSLPVVVLRIFNTYGPRMQTDDGRVVSNFIGQALRGVPMEIHGDGSQTRSFQYIHDLVDAILLAAFNGRSPSTAATVQPINIGCPSEERSLLEFAQIVWRKIRGRKDECLVTYTDRDIDDPKRRKPDISRAKELLNWGPKWSLDDGLTETIDYFVFKNGQVP